MSITSIIPVEKVLVNIIFGELLVPDKVDVRQAFGKIVISTPINYYQNDGGLNFWDTDF
jgi:hypothetical protein